MYAVPGVCPSNHHRLILPTEVRKSNFMLIPIQQQIRKLSGQLTKQSAAFSQLVPYLQDLHQMKGSNSCFFTLPTIPLLPSQITLANHPPLNLFHFLNNCSTLSLSCYLIQAPPLVECKKLSRKAKQFPKKQWKKNRMRMRRLGIRISLRYR